MHNLRFNFKHNNTSLSIVSYVVQDYTLHIMLKNGMLMGLKSLLSICIKRYAVPKSIPYVHK